MFIINMDDEVDVDRSSGMTYRKWLIVQALAGMCANQAYEGDSRVPIGAIQVADEVLAAMEEDGKA